MSIYGNIAGTTQAPYTQPAPKPFSSGGFSKNILSSIQAPFKPTNYSTPGFSHDPGSGMPKNSSPTVPASGTESGPGILESWFNQRANGIDAASQYAMKRGADDIDRRMAAGGSYNSGARGQQLSDFAANVEAQRESQLDSLAAGASGEHQGRLNSMFAQGLGLAGGQSGVAGQYDIGAANALSAADQQQLQLLLAKAGVDSQANQGFINNLFNGVKTFYGGKNSNS